jgi:hypothetical protein
MTHGDGSADFSPVGGFFEENLSMTDYWGRNLGVKRREQELIAAVKELT